MKLVNRLAWVCVLGLAGAAGAGVARQFGLVPTGTLLIFSLLGLSGAALPAALCAAALARGRAPRWMISGIMTAALAYLIWLGVVMTGATMRVGPRAIATVPAAWAVLMSLVAILILPRHRSTLLTVLQGLGIVFAIALTVATGTAIALLPNSGPISVAIDREVERIVTLGGALTVLYGGATTLVWLGARMRQLLSGDTEIIGEHRMRVMCPRCGNRQQMTTGRDACGECGLIVKITPA